MQIKREIIGENLAIEDIFEKLPITWSE